VGNKLYYYKDGVYRDNGKYIAKQLIKFDMISQDQAERWEKKLSDDTVEYITIDSPRLWPKPPLDIINLQNGLYDLKAGVLRAHSPRHYSPIQLPVRYHPQAQCPRIDRFIREVFPDDSTELAYEIAAWLMVPDTSIQKAILLLGSGGNGKSTYLNLLVHFIGKANTTSLSLHKLEENTFAAAGLVGKLANVCPDLPTRDLQNTSIFKMLTGGEAQMSAERKHADAFEFEPFVRLVFSANEYPRSGDMTDAFIERWVVIPFPYSFRNQEREKQRRDLDAELTDPEELSEFLNRALQRLPPVLWAGFSPTQSTTEALKGFRQMTDKVAVWLNERTITEGRAIVSKDALHQAYIEDTGDSGMYKETFGAHVMRLRKDHGVRDGQRTYNGRPRVTCWIGIGLKEE
jgi:P4 family phage/plasmid primase-like protien